MRQLTVLLCPASFSIKSFWVQNPCSCPCGACRQQLLCRSLRGGSGETCSRGWGFCALSFKVKGKMRTDHSVLLSLEEDSKPGERQVPSPHCSLALGG